MTPTPITSENHIDSKDSNTNSRARARQSSETTLTKIATSTCGDIIWLGDQAFSKADLHNAFGGDLRPGVYQTPARPMGNPAALGLTGFVICTFVVSMSSIQARGLHNAEVLGGAALFLGGAIEAIAGFWCLLVENTFGATTLGGFGGFWMSYWAVMVDAWGIRSSYTTERELETAVGFFLTVWTLFAFVMWLCTFRATWPFFLLFLLVWVFFMLMTIGAFTGITGFTKAGGYLSLIATFDGFYLIYASVAHPSNALWVPKPLPMPWAQVV